MSEVCPDWVDMVCNRGTRCKQSHPADIKQPEKRLNICRDFQNAICRRSENCIKFRRKHFTRDEESSFYKTGVMPDHHGDPDKIDSIGKAENYRGNDGEQCRDDLKPGGCPRGSNCVYRHVDEPMQSQRGGYNDNYEPQMNMRAGPGGMGQMGMLHRGGYQNDRMEPPTKRSAMMQAGGGGMMGGGGGMMAELQMKDEKIDDFRQKIHDLRNMNDLLYEQNENLRKKLTEKENEIGQLKSGSGQAYTSFAEPDLQSRRSARDADLYD